MVMSVVIIVLVVCRLVVIRDVAMKAGLVILSTVPLRQMKLVLRRVVTIDLIYVISLGILVRNVCYVVIGLPTK